MQRRSARVPGGRGPAATGERVHLTGPQSGGKVKQHTSCHLWDGIETSQTRGVTYTPGVCEAFITGLA